MLSGIGLTIVGVNSSLVGGADSDVRVSPGGGERHRHRRLADHEVPQAAREPAPRPHAAHLGTTAYFA